MRIVKRVLRVGAPVALLALGVTVYAQSRSTDCAHLTLMAKVMQATGMQKIKPCDVIQMGDSTPCVEQGRHCNVGSGPGKCTNVADDAGYISCQCVK